ncbi:hypothetical protein C1H46_009628 [Malus baccata]|uniref:Uncharacterized protein n=1 Tax=Malus baccata TaxID=106549 RepID=A0A540N185_MALBA|nr:hypothetical protein C1H46_009628 [Malus baccata]
MSYASRVFDQICYPNILLFCEMLDQSFEPDEATVVLVLPACVHLGAVDVGKWIHS